MPAARPAPRRGRLGAALLSLATVSGGAADGAADAGAAGPGLAGFSARAAAAQARLEQRFLELPSPPAFRAHLERLTRDPHPFGSAANAAVADYLAAAMARAGLEVEECACDVYAPLSNPDVDVALVRPVRLPLNTQEYILPEDPFSAHPEARPGWNAYSASGDVTAEVVYANYGRREDFAELAGLGVSLEGRIALARYGGNYRGFKARYAEAAGAVGVILYTDPADGGYPSGPVYPEGPHWPESAVQRGSLKTLAYAGDPLTPFVPAHALDSGRPVERLDPEAVALPRIPVTPLSYGAAREILGRMRGEPAPRAWQGALPFTYRVTDGPELTVRLRVDQSRGLVRARNVVGRLRGTEFPDEWVILGCHYDAWTFGAVDPNGGTAMLLTLAEALGELARQGHRPRRSILICHWDAEEFGIIGSTEWVEERRGQLEAAGVAYLNADVSVSGPAFGAAASPSLKRAIIEATRAVVHPDTAASVYRTWHPAGSAGPEPGLGDLGGGSDHLAFYTHVGIPAAGLGLHGPSLYHSLYDDLTYFERFCDPRFEYGPTVARLHGILALRLANADLIPYDVGGYGRDLERHLADLEKRAAERGLALPLPALRAAVAELSAVAARVDSSARRYLEAGRRDAASLAAANRRLIGLERAFILESGLQEQAWSRSLYAAPDPFSGYAAWVLPGLRYEVEVGDLEAARRWEATYLAALQELTARVRALLAALEG